MFTCSITYIAYSSCCFIRKACIWFRKILRWLSLSRNGTRMATRCRDVQFSGTKPPSFITPYFCSIVVHVCGSVLLTVMLPTRYEKTFYLFSMRKEFSYVCSSLQAKGWRCTWLPSININKERNWSTTPD